MRTHCVIEHKTSNNAIQFASPEWTVFTGLLIYSELYQLIVLIQNITQNERWRTEIMSMRDPKWSEWDDWHFILWRNVLINRNVFLFIYSLFGARKSYNVRRLQYKSNRANIILHLFFIFSSAFHCLPLHLLLC